MIGKANSLPPSSFVLWVLSEFYVSSMWVLCKQFTAPLSTCNFVAFVFKSSKHWCIFLISFIGTFLGWFHSFQMYLIQFVQIRATWNFWRISVKNLTAGDDRSGGCWCRYKVQQLLQKSVNEHIRMFTSAQTWSGIWRCCGEWEWTIQWRIGGLDNPVENGQSSGECGEWTIQWPLWGMDNPVDGECSGECNKLRYWETFYWYFLSKTAILLNISANVLY